MFLNPFGFDAIFATIQSWTGSFWATDMILYCLAGSCFGLSLLLRDKNEIKKQEAICPACGITKQETKTDAKNLSKKHRGPTH